MSDLNMLRLLGAPGSPYTRKMLAIMRYRHIPYKLLLRHQVDTLGLPEPKVSLLPTYYFEEGGKIVPTVDSTPIIRKLEKDFNGKSVLPPDPVVGFLDYILEDYGDEWLTKAMFHYRWHFAPDTKKAGDVLPRWSALTASEEDLQYLGKAFADRQTSRLYVVGSNETTAPVIEDSYKRFIRLFDAHMAGGNPFLMGARPGASDFSIYGQLTQLTGFDPTAVQVTLDIAPRITSWTEVMEDLSGLDPTDQDWLTGTTVPETLRAILAEVGKVYTPVLMANVRALMGGAEMVETEIDGKAWTQKPFPYQGKCVQWIREQYAALSDEHQNSVDEILDGTGLEPLIKETL